MKNIFYFWLTMKRIIANEQQTFLLCYVYFLVLQNRKNNVIATNEAETESYTYHTMCLFKIYEH